VRIVLRALTTTVLTVTVLGVIVATRADHGPGGGTQAAPTVVVLGDLPESLPGLDAETGGAAPAGGLSAAVAALRTYLGGGTATEAAHEEPEGVRSAEPEKVRVNLGRPSGSGDVRVNRGLP
jgi:hypothetical protein